MTVPTNTNRPSGEPRLASVASWMVLTASFGLSATTWIALARLAGFTATLTLPRVGVTLAMAWLMPIAVDGYVVVALVLWMSPVPAKVATFAKRNTYGAAGIGIAAQSAYHLLFTLSTTDQTWRVVLAAIVGALPPAVAGLAVHMRALIRRESGTSNTGTSEPPTMDATTVPAAPAAPVTPSTVDTPVLSTDPAPAPVKEPEPVVPTPAVVAARITRPNSSTRTSPAPVPAAVDRAARTRTGAPATPAATLTPPATDTHVTTPGAAQLALPIVSPALLDRATDVARKHRSEHGTRITPGQLAVRLKVTTDLANQLLEVLDDQPVTAPTVNGRPHGATV
jgi:hypothetical protein